MKWVLFRWACPEASAAKLSRVGGTLHCLFDVGMRLLPTTAQTRQGQHAAVRALAFKWIRVVFRCWKDGVAYDETKYLAALAQRGSQLSAVLVQGKTF
jgi:hypothetical protein